MNDKKCVRCPRKKNCSDSWASWIFFLIGLIATVAIRVVTVLMEVHPAYGKVAWYVGVIGFFLFFIYKYNEGRLLAGIVEEGRLIEKSRARESFTDEQYDHIANILCSIKSEKERINYFFIFAVSAVALIFAVYFDFMR